MCFLGVIATQAIRKDDIVLDYHGVDYHGVDGKRELKKLMANGDPRLNFSVEIHGPPYRLIDASSETCPTHPTNRCLGRLVNHVTTKENPHAANVKITEILLAAHQERVVVFKAQRDILPFEQLRFDYVDKNARDMFPEHSENATDNDDDPDDDDDSMFSESQL